jgi:hypothetical protein
MSDAADSDKSRPAPTAAFFASATADGWYQPTDNARGPWAVDASHAGPPAGALGREFEARRPDAQLTRVTVELGRPLPMAGFRIDTEVAHAGRTVTTAEAKVIDAQDRICARATA